MHESVANEADEVKEDADAVGAAPAAKRAKVEIIKPHEQADVKLEG